MDAAEEAEWLALESIEPWGEAAANYRAAVCNWRTALAHWSGQGPQPQLKTYLKDFDFVPADHDDERDDEVLETAARK